MVPIETRSPVCSTVSAEGAILNFLVTRGYRDPIELWLQSRRGREVADRFRLTLYEEIPVRGEVPAGTWVFGDIERLGPAGRELAVRLRDALETSGAPVTILNDPRFALDRYPLLKLLHTRGVNRFRAVRADEPPPTDLRYPVFLRMERQHGGALTPLLRDRRELDAALRRLTSVRLGYRRRDLLVVEFVDVSGGSGIYNRYTAFRVGDRIVPKRVEFNRSWSVSAHSRYRDATTTEAEIEYIEGNPHADVLLPIFDLGAIDYGRVDYGILDDEIQVWEINTNPMIGGSLPRGHRAGAFPQDPATRPARDRFHERMREAVKAVDRDGGARRIDLRNPAHLVARARAERADYRWRTRYRRWMKGLDRASWRASGRGNPKEGR